MAWRGQPTGAERHAADLERLGQHGQPGIENEFLSRVLDTLTRLPSGLRQTLADQKWQQIAAVCNEYASNPNAASLTLPPKTNNLFRVTTIVATIPTGQTGTLKLADLSLALPAGNTIIPMGDCGGFLLEPSDPRTLTATAAGALSLWLSGEILSPIEQLT